MGKSETLARVKESRIQESFACGGIFTCGIPALGFEIRDTAQGIWNPTNGYFPALIAHSQVFSTLQDGG